MDHTLLTATEVAERLKIKKNTVYELIKRGELPSCKVGKQLRVSAADIEHYLLRGKTGAPGHAPLQEIEAAAGATNMQGAFILSGQDICLELIVNHFSRHGEKVLRNFTGCYDSLVRFYHGEVTVAALHLWDMETGGYNQPFITRMAPGEQVSLLRLCGRTQGFYIQKGNPRNILGWEDLKRDDIVFANREKGCGTRALLDQKRKQLHIVKGIKGYDKICSSHMAVASCVAGKEADFGLGCEKGGAPFDNLGFIPLQKEWYDLAFYTIMEQTPFIQSLIDYIRSPHFSKELASLGGYDCTQTGKLIQV